MWFSKIESKFIALKIRIRAVFFFSFFQQLNVKILGKITRWGKGCRVIGANRFVVYPNCIFECYNKSAQFIVGDDCILSYGVLVSVSHKIKLGKNVWIGEYSSIRDSSHIFSVKKLLGESGDWFDSIEIGDNVWIGRGCVILPGTIIGNNVIIGANSVVSGVLECNSMYAGAPAMLKKRLND